MAQVLYLLKVNYLYETMLKYFRKKFLPVNYNIHAYNLRIKKGLEYLSLSYKTIAQKFNF